MRRRLILPSIVALTTAGCGMLKSAASKVENALFSEPEYPSTPGENALPFLQSAVGAPAFDAAALSQAMNISMAEAAQEAAALRGDFSLLAEGPPVPEVSDATIDLLVAGAPQKAQLKSGSFVQPSLSKMFVPKKESGAALTDFELAPDEFDGYDPVKSDTQIDDAAWEGRSEIIISQVGRVPVRDQGARGTCASFTGIGQLEYLIMKKYGATLPTVDLSEQRFYMMSKPDVWATGGVTDVDSGSSLVTGFEISFGKGGKTSPSDHLPWNIPLESDCPYNNKPGANEIQIAQQASCKRGAVRVSNVTKSYFVSSNGGPWKFKTSGAPRTAREIFDFIKTRDLPVPVGTVLTANWMDNDGMITLAKSQQPGQGPHAGGHAYLIVGMRKIDPAKFPGEGGMCFVIKNSWGTGWGVNGYSCMTLAWFNTFRNSNAFDLALDVEIDKDYLAANAAGTVPSNIGPAPVAVPAVAPAPEPTPVLTNVTDPGEPKGGTPVSGDGGGTPPNNAPAQSGGYTLGKLMAKTGDFSQVLFKKDGGELHLRGVHVGQKATTEDLTLRLDGERLLFDDDLRNKKNVVAGVIQNDVLTLCAGKYAMTCDLNYLKDENRLVIGITEAEFRNYEADPDADYSSLFSLGQYGVEAAIGEGVFGDFRLKFGGQPTNPIRLAIKPISGSIMYLGQEIGNYQKLEFCSGSFQSVCRILVNQKDRSLKIMFKAKKS